MISNRNRFLICFFAILLTWIISSQEIWLFRAQLHSQLFTRYLLYFLWMAITATIGIWAFIKLEEKWVLRLWLWFYSLVFLILIAVGLADVLFLHLKPGQKFFIQQVRQFMQSPAPLVIFYLLHKLAKNQER